MAESTITVKGQPTVPVDIRAKTKSILDMAGTLKAPKGKHVSVHDMTPWR